METPFAVRLLVFCKPLEAVGDAALAVGIAAAFGHQLGTHRAATAGQLSAEAAAGAGDRRKIVAELQRRRFGRQRRQCELMAMAAASFDVVDLLSEATSCFFSMVAGVICTVSSGLGVGSVPCHSRTSRRTPPHERPA